MTIQITEKLRSDTTLFPRGKSLRAIGAYQKKYGLPFKKFAAAFSSEDAPPDEITDYMDWKLLTLEKAERMKIVRKKS